MGKKIILCVDDENIILQSLRNSIKNTFTEFGIEIAESGEEALELFKEIINSGNEVPVVIIDYIMPGMKGDELLKRIHSISERTQKIMLSGQATIEGVTNAINNANLYKYIEKPWNNEELKVLIQEAVERYDAISYLDLENSALMGKKEMLEKEIREKVLKLEDMRQELKEKGKDLDPDEVERNLKLLCNLYEKITLIKSKVDLSVSEDNIGIDEIEEIIQTLNNIRT